PHREGTGLAPGDPREARAMNELGVLLLGAAVRCTAFAVLGVLMYALLRRQGPSAGALVALATLLMLVAVSVLSLSPWPRWWAFVPPGVAVTATSRPETGVAAGGDRAVPPRVAETDPALERPARAPLEAAESRGVVFLRELWQAVEHPR